MWYTADNHNYMCHICAKEVLNSNFNKAVIDKILNFHEIVPNFTYSQKSYISCIIRTFKTNFFFPLNFMAGTCKESTF